MALAATESSPPRAGRAARIRQHRDAAPHGDIDLLIVDDRRVDADAGWALVGCQPHMGVLANAASAEEALSAAHQHTPHVCVVSATLADWISLAGRLKQLGRPTRVLICDAGVDIRVTGAAIVADADGVLDGRAAPEELADSIRRVAAGAKCFPRLRPDQLHELLDCVDDPDRAIVAMLLERVPADYIASTLGLSARSLRERRHGILQRLDDACTLDAIVGAGVA
jgi:two-component system response regulator DesR